MPFESQFDYGEMAEWSNAAVLKTVVPKGTGGSNPSLSATLRYSANGTAIFSSCGNGPGI